MEVIKKNTKILDTIWVQIFQPYPFMEGGIKIEVIEKLVRDPMLQNMIFKAN